MTRNLAWTPAAWADYVRSVHDSRVTIISCRYHYQR